MNVTQVLLNPPEQVEKWLDQAVEMVGRKNLGYEMECAVLPEVLRLLAHGAILAPPPAAVPMDFGKLGLNGRR